MFSILSNPHESGALRYSSRRCRFNTLHRGSALGGDFGDVADGMSFFEQSNDVPVLPQKHLPIHRGSGGPSEPLSLSPGFRQAGVNSFPQALDLGPRHLGEKGQHYPGGWIALPVWQEGFDALGMPVEGHATLFQRLHEVVGDAVLAGNARDFMHKHLLDFPCPGKLHDMTQAVALIFTGATGHDFLANLYYFVFLAICIGFEFGDLA